MADKVSIKKMEQGVDIPKISLSENREECYHVSDFSKAAKTLFGVQPECVIAAFFNAEKDIATEKGAKKIVSDFMMKEVK